MHGAGLNKTCTDGGKAVVRHAGVPEGLGRAAGAARGQVDAYFADSPVAGYYTVQQPDQFELSGVTVEVADEGISVPKDTDPASRRGRQPP